MQILDILGPEPSKGRREWFDEECKAAIEDRNKAHQEYLARSGRHEQEIYEEKDERRTNYAGRKRGQP
jgi:hypothetical protein